MKIPLAGKVKPEPPCTAAIGKASLQPSRDGQMARPCPPLQLWDWLFPLTQRPKAAPSGT